MKLRRYSQFINESVEITDDLIKLLIKRSEFYDEIRDLDYKEFDLHYNYSDLCKLEDGNPEKDFEKIQKHFSEIGFTLEELKNLFSEENNKKCGYDLNDFYIGNSSIIHNDPIKSVIKHLINKPSATNDNIINTIKRPFIYGLDSQNAVVDVYLYFLFKKLGVKGTVWLGGPGWGDIEEITDSGLEYSESFIRYKYGYHQTEYGKLWMNQNNINEEWLKNMAKCDIQQYLADNLINLAGRLAKFSRDTRLLEFKDYVIIEEDRIIIDLKKLANDINNCPDEYEENLIINLEDIASEIIRDMNYFGLEIELSYDGELVIWSDFDDNIEY